MELEEMAGIATIVLTKISLVYFIHKQKEYIRRIKSDAIKLLDGMTIYLAPHINSRNELSLFGELTKSRIKNQI